jgi:twinkle protein
MAKSKCVEKIGSVQIFQQEDGSYDAFDFATGKYIPDPYKDKPPGYKPVVIKKSQEQINAELEEIQTYKVFDLPERKLRKESLDYFGVRIGVSESDGHTPTIHYYPYTREGTLLAYKVRIIEGKRMWVVGSFKDVDFFGWEQAKATGGKRLYITEGEVDCVSLYQIFKDQNKGTQYADFNPAVVSLPNGCGGAVNFITKKLKEIKEHFKEIVLVFDMDEPGKKAAEECIKLIPECIVASLPSKDVNDCLVEGRSKACYNAVQFNAKRPKNSRIVSGNDLHESSKEIAKFGLSFPWQWLTEKTRGLRFGEVYYLGAGQKQGKSEVVNTITAHCIKEHGLKVFLAKPEEANKKTYKLVAGKLMGKFFHDPTKPFDEDAYEEAGEILKDKLFMLNLYQHLGWESLKADIREAASDGCKIIMIDPITNLTNGMESGAANVKLQEIAQELSAMALDLDVAIFVFCHLRNPDGGPPHERGGEVLSSQFAGSRAMARSCNYMLGLEGNRDPNLTKEERNIRHLVLLEDREYGEVGRMAMYWDESTGLFNEIKH